MAMHFRLPSVDCRFLWRLTAAFLILTAIVFAQAPPQPAPPQAQQQPPPQTKPQAPAPEQRITPEQAKELLGAVDEVLQFDSKDTALSIRHEVKRQLADRDQVQRYIQDRIRDDEDTQRLRRAEVVLKKLGLLPRDFDLEGFLVQLMREQVAGYYDTKKKTVYLLDWLQPASQLPVMAHELTHALQDQNYGLEKWMEKGTSEKTPTQEALGDEEIAARHAVVEGQAMAVMIDYLLSPTGGSVVNSPQITAAIQQGMMDSPDSPVFNRAPLFMKRVLLFPYRYGLDFERELLIKRGKAGAYAGVFDHPPMSTRQIMQPETYLADEKLPELPIPDIAKILGKSWEKYDVGSIGEFDVAVMGEVYANGDTAKKIYPQWRGGWYYAAKANDGGTLALVMVTRWADLQAASAFSTLCAGAVPRRYTIRPGSPAGGVASTSGTPGGAWSTQWQTTDGPVELVRSGDTVVTIEGIPAESVEKVRAAVLVK